MYRTSFSRSVPDLSGLVLVSLARTGPEAARLDLILLNLVCATVIACAQTAGWIKMPLGMKVGLDPGHIVLDGDPAALPQKVGTASPHFSAHVCCGQMAGWIKVPLGTMVGLDQCNIVLDVDPAPPRPQGA